MTIKRRLSQWWAVTDNTIVAVSADEQVDWQSFQQNVSDWVAVLAEQPGNKWAVYHDDACQFLAMVFALWQVGKTAVVAGDNLTGTETHLQSLVDGFIGEFHAATLQPAANAKPSTWHTLPNDFVALNLFTSGSTGQPEMVKKTMMHLEQELDALTDFISEEDHVTLATVSHQHLYGLTFRLLLPFCMQQPFAKCLLAYPEDIIQAAKAHKRFSLISSPAHLARMTQDQDWQSISQRCVKVISSAAPLLRQDSLDVSTYLEADVLEIYGSTETGAIAWRCQQKTQQDALWQPLAHVAVMANPDQTIMVKLTAEKAEIPLADRVEFKSTGEFKLLGRKDQIVKVEGKRLSLSELEDKLLALGLFDVVKALVLNRKRHETVIAAVLSEVGQEVLRKQGRKAFVSYLKQHLAMHFESVLIPRRWRFVSALPTNSQGKLTLQSVTALFDKTDNKWPILLAEKAEDGVILLSCSLPENLTYFDGHFAEQAVLPGVVQVHWAAKYGQEFFAIKSAFKRLEVIKFQQLMLPGQLFTLSLRFDSDKAKLHFMYESDSGVHSSGRICYGD
ncbi:AMP-binding protein [Methylophaga sp. OBS3]|uniref:ApeI family dehydratase n=1 Tax=Methylophaga sp. OBS3 TaxID=2991934 RepID=UPI00225B17AE|nr:AMP-binding protein [Methylophaga sp. OBS3]MCX4189067.1 AMP-binding protein [Methylophaga sp. OBS3]